MGAVIWGIMVQEGVIMTFINKRYWMYVYACEFYNKVLAVFVVVRRVVGGMFSGREWCDCVGLLCKRLG